MIDTSQTGLVLPRGMAGETINRALPKVEQNPNIISDLGIEAFNGKMIVRQMHVETKYVIIPHKARGDIEKSEGTVLMMSEEAMEHLPKVRVGDYVAWGTYASAPIVEGGEDENLYIVDCGDIMYKKNKPNTEDTK